MFRLKATLVATTPMRPWRTGWSADRGVDFSIPAPARPATAPPAARGAPAPAEPASFLDEGSAAPPGAAVLRSVSGLAAVPADIEPSSEDAPDTPGVRAWWSLASKTSRT